MAESASRPLILWSISDGRAGHLAQSRGLIRALSELTPCRSHEIAAPPAPAALAGLAAGRAPFAEALPAPDFIVGAGHGTHLPVLCARRARGGRSIVLMRPSLPLSLFDFCLIPEHDNPPARPNVIATRGPLNPLRPAARRQAGAGLILIGGPSRHFRWDRDALLAQIRAITERQPRHWVISDSPRTPAATRRALAGAGPEYRPWDRCPPAWLEDQLGRAETVWISRDSMSMIFEALTAGAAVGLLDVPPRGPSRLIRAIDGLVADGLVTPYPAWAAGAEPAPPPAPLDEARRCAALLLGHPEALP